MLRRRGMPLILALLLLLGILVSGEQAEPTQSPLQPYQTVTGRSAFLVTGLIFSMIAKALGREMSLEATHDSRAGVIKARNYFRPLFEAEYSFMGRTHKEIGTLAAKITKELKTVEVSQASPDLILFFDLLTKM